MSAAVQAAEAPPIEAGAHRPRFWTWITLNERGLRELGDVLGCSHQTLWFLILPWNDPRRTKRISLELALAIEALTGGEVRADRDWTPPAEGEGAGA